MNRWMLVIIWHYPEPAWNIALLWNRGFQILAWSGQCQRKRVRIPREPKLHYCTSSTSKMNEPLQEHEGFPSFELIFDLRTSRWRCSWSCLLLSLLCILSSGSPRTLTAGTVALLGCIRKVWEFTQTLILEGVLTHEALKIYTIAQLCS